MNKKSVFIFGKTGRMGREVEKIVRKTPSLHLVGGMTNKSEDIKIDLSPDIVIDFSLPQAFDSLKNFIKKHNSCLVSGTTGLRETQKKQLEEMGKKVPVFWSANMSFGIYIMIKITEKLARYNKFYKYRIEETHHTHKKDKPSGTSLIIEKAAKKFTNPDPIISYRKDEVFGIHRFIAVSENEQLEICHRALNRKLFAHGAINISLWLCEQSAGFYSMEDFFKNL